MLEIVVIVLQVLFLLFLALLAPIGMWWRSDPSREAAGWIESAEEALARGEPLHALALARQAMSWPWRGRYSVRQAQTSARALEVAERSLHALDQQMPAELAQVRARLEAGERDLGDLTARARATLDHQVAAGRGEAPA